MLKNLFLRQSSLWPRFHVTVAKSLEGKKKAEVVELDVPITDSMKDIQNAILECIEASIAEIRKSNSNLDIDQWNVDNALNKNFVMAIRRQLDPVWHRVTVQTRKIVNDLGVLQEMLQSVKPPPEILLLTLIATC